MLISLQASGSTRRYSRKVVKYIRTKTKSGTLKAVSWMDCCCCVAFGFVIVCVGFSVGCVVAIGVIS